MSAAVLVLIDEDDAAHRALPLRALDALWTAQRSAIDEARAKGWTLSHARFDRAADPWRLSQEGGALLRERAPSSASPSAVLFVESPSDAETAQWIASFPRLATDRLASRSVMKGRIDPGWSSEPGRVFACSVHGAAPSRDAWNALMDRVDRDTAAQMAAAPLLAGVRLNAPAHAPVRADLDGPFIESKELLGGLFFLRVASLDDALEWASRSAFLSRAGDVSLLVRAVLR